MLDNVYVLLLKRLELFIINKMLNFMLPNTSTFISITTLLIKPSTDTRISFIFLPPSPIGSFDRQPYSLSILTMIFSHLLSYFTVRVL